VGSRLILLLLGWAVVWAVPVLAASDDGPKLTAVVAPAEVSLTPGSKADVTLVVTNGSDAPMAVKVEAVPAARSVSVDGPADGPNVEAGGATALRFMVTRRSESTGQDVPVIFVATGKSVVAGAGGSPTLSAVATLTVKAAASPSLIEAKIDFNTQNINEKRSGDGVLEVKNLRESDVRVQQFEVSAPPDVDVVLICPDTGNEMVARGGTVRHFTRCSPTVSPVRQLLVQIHLQAADSVTPGPRVAVVQVLVIEPETGSTGSAVASISFTTDVFAESDLLKAVGVPIFLLLPGVVIVVSAWFLVTRLTPWTSRIGGAKLVGVSGAVPAAILSVAVSLVVAAAYPWLTRVVYPGHERDYLSSYGFRDFYYVLALSFGIAVTVWMLSLLAYLLMALERWLVVPEPNELPRNLLRKVGIRGIYRRSIDYPSPSIAGKRGFVLGNRAGGKSLASPAIGVEIDDGADSKLRGKVEGRIRGKPFRLWRVVRRADLKKHAKTYYRRSDIDGVKLVDRPPPSAQSGPIVEVDPQ